MPHLIRLNPTDPDEKILRAASEILKAGGILAYPTETFYGLGVDALNESAVEKIFAIKGRDYAKPLPLIIGNHQALEPLIADVPEAAFRLMERFWPGALTLVFDASPLISPKLTGGTGKIGVRLSGNPIASGLSLLLGHPVTATSANLSGKKECVSAEEALMSLGEKMDAVIDGGRTPGGPGSTILDVSTDPPAVIRVGAVALTLIRQALEQS